MENINYEEAVKIGIREGIKYIKEQEYSKTTKKYDRRLRNTRLLLRHYRSLKAHSKISDSTINYIEEDNVIDVLDDIEDISTEEQYVQAIRRTKVRTKNILRHIDKAMKYYEYICKAEGENKLRRYNIIDYVYIDPKNNELVTYEEAAEHFDLNIKTVGRDVRLAIEDLSILFFGIDGLKL
ncbi:MAG: hypothetical protein ACRDA4_10615 [Filifactoraceae bacterium]